MVLLPSGGQVWLQIIGYKADGTLMVNPRPLEGIVPLVP
jgi:hypothetical protein